MYTVFHSYKDDELVRYALNAIDHPAVQEICSRLNNVTIELNEIDDINELQEELDTANERINELETEVARKDGEIEDLQCQVCSLEQELTDTKQELNHAI